MKNFTFLLTLIWSLSSFAGPVHAAPAAAVLSYQELIEKGSDALHRQDTEQAMDYFMQAHLRNPFAAQAFLGLSAAHHSEGNLILALIWREAMRELTLTQEMRAQVREVSETLQRDIQQKITELLHYASETIEGFPEPLQDEKRAALGTLTLLYSVNGDRDEALKIKAKSIYRDAPEEALLRYAGEHAAMTHNYRRVQTLAEKMSAPKERDRLWRSLAKAQLARNEHAQGRQTVQKIQDKAMRHQVLKWAALSLIKDLDFISAANWIEEIRDEALRLDLYDRLAEGYLKADEANRARQLVRYLTESLPQAKKEDKKRVTFAILRSPENFKQSLMNTLKTLEPRSQQELLYRATLNTFWLGLQSDAEDYCEMLKARRTQSVGYYADFACASIDSNIQSFLNVFEQYPYEIAEPFLESRVMRSFGTGDVKQAYELIQKYEEPAKKARALHRLSRIAQAHGLREEAAGLANESYLLALQSQSASVFRDIAKDAAAFEEDWFLTAVLTNEKIVRRAKQAELLAQKPEIANLEAFLNAEQSGDLRDLAQALLSAAAEWQYALNVIEGLAEWDEEAPW